MFKWSEPEKGADGKTKLLYRHERLFTEGVIKEGLKVLDVGGWGILYARVVEENAQCLILDKFTEDQMYPERVLSCNCVAGDILDQDLLGTLGRFDVVTCFEMLEHCLDQERAIINIYSILNDGGVFAGTVPIPGRTHPVDDPDVTFIGPDRLRSLLELAGFTVKVLEPTGSITAEEEPASIYFKAEK